MRIWSWAAFPTFFCGVLCLFLSVARAQDPGDSPGPAPDYSAGFRKLMSVGIPDLSQAVYVRLGITNERSQMHGFDELSAARKGNAWLLSEADGVGTFLRTTDWITVTVKRIEEEIWKPGLVAGPLMGTWTPQDLEMDAESTLAVLERLSRSADRHDDRTRRELGPFGGEVDSASALLFATSLFAHGHGAKANRIAELLFAGAPDSRALLTGALSTIFDGRYLSLVSGFGESADWQTFHDGVRDLLSRAGPVWRHSGSAKLVLDRVAKHLKEDRPAFSGEGLTEVQQDAAHEFLGHLPSQQVGSDSLRGCGLWLLLPPPHLVYDQGSDGLLRLLSLRRDALAVLLAWVGDDSLIPVFSLPAGGMHDHRDWKTMMSIQAVYGNSGLFGLPTPQTRGDIASDLLWCLTFRGDGGGGGMFGMFDDGGGETAGMDRAEAEALVKDILSADDRTLALRYLREGDMGQMDQAATYLLGDASAAELDAVVAATTDMMNAVRMPYVGLKIARLLSREYPDKAEALISLAERNFGTEQYIKEEIENLRRLMQPKKAAETTLEALLTTLVDSTEPDMQGDTAQALVMACRDRSRREILEAFLDAAARADDNTAACLLAQHVMCDRRADGNDPYMMFESAARFTWESVFEARKKVTEAQHREAVPAAAEDVREGLELIRSCAPRFRELLARGEGEGVASDPYAIPVADVAAGTVAMLAVGGPGQWYATHGAALMSFPDEGRGWTRRVAAQLVDGEIDTIPAPPNPDSVSSERRAALADELSRLEADRLTARLAELPDAEQLAVDIMIRTGEIPAAAKTLAENAKRVAKATCTLQNDALKSALAETVGRPVDRALVETLVAAVKTYMTETRRSCVCSVQFRQDGTAVFLLEAPARALGFMHGNENMPAMVNGMLSWGETYSHAAWPLAPGQAGGQHANLDAKLDGGIAFRHFGGDEDQFWKAVDKISASDTPPPHHATLFIQGIMPPPKTDNE